jgi:hypothetical protein
MKPIDLCLALVKAGDEIEVQKIIDQTPYLHSASNWLPYGDNETMRQIIIQF